MFPPKGSGLEQIKRAIESQYPGFLQSRIFEPLNNADASKALQNLQTSVHKMFSDFGRNISTTISQITNKAPQEDYNAIAAEFMTPDARLIAPLHPSGSNAIIAADVDGDSNNEIIASYKHTDNSIRTLILKKEHTVWKKLSEIVNPNCDEIHYRNLVNLESNGKAHLLLGLSQKEHQILHAYSLESDRVKELFSHNYNRFELIMPTKSSISRQTRFAFWNENNEKPYDIDLKFWNGKELEALDPQRYYYNRVVPQYTRKLKRQPSDIGNWYQLAHVLVSSGAKKDAKKIINYAMKRDKNSQYTDKFWELLNKL